MPSWNIEYDNDGEGCWPVELLDERGVTIASFTAEDVQTPTMDVARIIMAAPRLLAACELLISKADNSYCEWCDRHAPKNDEGYLTGPILHQEGCPYVVARIAIADAKGL